MRNKLSKLRNKYPSFFPPNLTWECADGWYDILNNMCQKLNNLNIRLTFVQIKEKYGTLRVYYECQGKTTRNEHETMNEIVGLAEAQSSHTCELCGNIGKLIITNGWYRTRCSHHAIMDKLEASVK
jgi:hypothetical protein